MSFRLVSKSATLNDLERRNEWPLFCVISPNSLAFPVHCVKVVEDIGLRNLLATAM